MNTKKKPTPLDDVQTVVKQNLMIQYALIIPIVSVFMWMFGFYYTWGSILVVAIGYSIRVVAFYKDEFYQNFTTQTKITANRREIQRCAWLNTLVRKYWTVCVPKFVEPQIEKVNEIMASSKPGFVKKMEISQWDLGDRAPRVTQIYTPVILSEDRYEVEIEILWVPSAVVTLEAQSYIPLKVVASELKFKARMKVLFNLNDLFPDCSVVSVAFLDDPLIEMSVRPARPLDALSLPFVYEMIQQTLRSNLRPLLVLPNQLQFSLGGGKVESFDEMDSPITDIILIPSGKTKAPPGYVLLQRTASGLLSANLNSGTAGEQLHICYARKEGEAPITSLAVFYPNKNGEKKPNSSYEIVNDTVDDLSTNSGNAGEECFICVSRDPNGKPITGLTLVNESEDYILPDDFRVLELSPQGHKANLNKKSGGDRVFLGFKGGCDTYFGYDKPVKNRNQGLVRVEIVEGRNLIAADLGGTSDPFVELLVGDEVPKKGAVPSFTSVIWKTLDPVWEETFIFEVQRDFSILTLDVYDKDAIAIASDHLGRIQLNLDKLVCGKQVDQWIPLQMVPKGELRVRITALDFGLSPEDHEVTAFVPRTVNKYNGQKLLSGLTGSLAGGIGTIGSGIAGVGGAGIDAVTNVGELGIKGVTGAVGGITGAVGTLFGRKKDKSQKDIVPPAEERSVDMAVEQPIKKKEKHRSIFHHSKSDLKPETKSEESVPEEPAVISTASGEEPMMSEISEDGGQIVDRTPTTREGHVKEASGLIGLGLTAPKVYAKLTQNSLEIYKSSSDPGKGKSPKESFPLGAVQLGKAREEKHAFMIIRNKKVFTYKCHDDGEMQAWLTAINNNKVCLQTSN